MATTEPEVDLVEAVTGLDALEAHAPSRPPLSARVWSSLWPKLMALAIGLGLWQLVVLSEWRPRYVLPSPAEVGGRLWDDAGTGQLWSAIGTTLRRGLWGFALAVAIGLLIGSLIGRSDVLRAAVGSLITGLQTMPSIAWFPLAILFFQPTEAAITFVVVLGAAPSVANGLIHGIDHIPPNLLRAGRVMGARGLAEYRHVVLPAAMPSLVAGLKQGWAFSWRSLMAGELLVQIARRSSLGQLLNANRELSDAKGLLAIMVVILLIGILMDGLVFRNMERFIRRRRGLLPEG
jgi:NitT/TauT family transport system permease protein